MTDQISQISSSGVRVRLVVSLPLLIILIAAATTVAVMRHTTTVLQRKALNYHIELAKGLAKSAELHVQESGIDVWGALGDEVALHNEYRDKNTGIRFVLFRTPMTGDLGIYDPEGQITDADQTQLLTITAADDKYTPHVLNIGQDERLYLVTAHPAVQTGYYLVAMEPFRNMREINRWGIWLAIIVTSVTALGLLAIAWLITAPLHKLAEKIRDLARRELVDPEEVDEIIERAKEPEEVATLALALEQALNSLVNLKRSVHGIIESMEGGVLSTNSEGRLEHVNSTAREIMGLEGPLIGKPVRQIIPSPEENRAFLAILDQLLDEQITYGRTREIEIRNGRGEVVQLGIATSIVPDQNGGILNAIVIMVDLTEMIELREHVRRADRMSSLGNMATKVAHEIRNPLGSVKGLGQLALESVEGDTETHKYLMRIVREVDRLSNIVGELLDYSQRRPLTLESVDINQLVRESVEMAQFRLGERGPTLLQELDLELPPVRMDRNRLLQAILNVVVNAVEAVGLDGAITVATYQEDGPQGPRVVLEISDNGPGIAPDTLEHIFDPFYTTKESGSGLGLSIAYNIIREHQGLLEVDSKLSQGTTFRIVLPQFQLEGVKV